MVFATLHAANPRRRLIRRYAEFSPITEVSFMIWIVLLIVIVAALAAVACVETLRKKARRLWRAIWAEFTDMEFPRLIYPYLGSLSDIMFGIGITFSFGDPTKVISEYQENPNVGTAFIITIRVAFAVLMWFLYLRDKGLIESTGHAKWRITSAGRTADVDNALGTKAVK
jgi:hypothetical protein